MLMRALVSLATLASTALAASLQQVNNFGSNPTNIQMYIYVPDRVVANPPIIVALHPCGGSGQQWFSGTQLPQAADQQGFILIYPSTPNQSNCWDVQNAGSLTHNGGGDAGGIISMVNYAVSTYNGDTSKIFVFGFSSGAMMTNVMAAVYPDVFAAGAAWSGVAHACFAGAPGATPYSPNQTCAQGLEHPADVWGAYVHNSYPGYTGSYPRMQIWHGLADGLVRPKAAEEALKQWSNVWGVSLTSTNNGVPSGEWQQQIYGDGQVQGYFGSGVGHEPRVDAQRLLTFFGI